MKIAYCRMHTHTHARWHAHTYTHTHHKRTSARTHMHTRTHTARLITDSSDLPLIQRHHRVIVWERLALSDDESIVTMEMGSLKESVLLLTWAGNEMIIPGRWRQAGEGVVDLDYSPGPPLPAADKSL